MGFRSRMGIFQPSRVSNGIVALNLAMLASLVFASVGGVANATVGTNDYPNAAPLYLSSAPKDSVTDPWGFDNRECTSFVAWRLNNDNGVNFYNGMPGPNGTGSSTNRFGSALNWASHAASIGYLVNSTPAAGSVAVWPSSVGHVAYVDSVNTDGTINTEEYNWNNDGAYHTRTEFNWSAAGVQFIHIKDLGGYRSAFQANNGYMYTFDSTSGAAATTQGMKPGTSPAITALSGGGYEEAFQANTGDLFVYGNGGSYDTQQGIMADTSPSIAANSSGGFRVAFQANNGYLYTFDSTSGTVNTGQGMKAGTSPAIAFLSTGGYEEAFQANNGDLFVYNPGGGGGDVHLGMMAGTSPAIASSSGGSYRVAFQANTGNLYYYDSSSGAANTGQGMKSGTSPSITRVPGGYEMAFQANTGNLFVNNPDGSGGNTYQGMMAGTSPSIAAASSAGGFRVAFQANNGYLYTYDASSGAANTGQGMASGTSPSMAAP